MDAQASRDNSPNLMFRAQEAYQAPIQHKLRKKCKNGCDDAHYAKPPEMKDMVYAHKNRTI